ncbi:hypothetical protein CHARACLAT_021355 [Characodon lateralis]|uniref:Uncharacterized protein n=1 Tax=Characodon lateralis TaxID=208331 RepID=A0ABU7CPZ9_9TELE|nr:hypothetical protein [Characodon lateralis]
MRLNLSFRDLFLCNRERMDRKPSYYNLYVFTLACRDLQNGPLITYWQKFRATDGNHSLHLCHSRTVQHSSRVIFVSLSLHLRCDHELSCVGSAATGELPLP